MPVELKVDKQLKKAGWKVKIRNKETGLERPHVSILRKDQTWRISLRDKEFMEDDPPPRLVPKELLDFIFNGKKSQKQSVWEWLCDKWDNEYSKNPISSNEKKDK